jgi:hypothetical protein
MAKRFTDTEKYRSPFYRGLKGPYKLLWDYLYHECTHAGIWIVDFEIAQIYIGSDMPIEKDEAIKIFNNGKERVVEFDNGNRWFIPSFIEHQYKGELNPDNRVHASVLLELKKHKLSKALRRALQGCKDKDKDKEKEQEQDKVKELDRKKQVIKDAIKSQWEKRKKFYIDKYPNRDYDLQLDSMVEWVDDNYSKASKKKDWNLFIQRWLERSVKSSKKTSTGFDVIGEDKIMTEQEMADDMVNQQKALLSDMDKSDPDWELENNNLKLMEESARNLRR